jgi:hypothetical protein
MEITGKVIQLLPLQSGEGRNGPWKKQEFILETAGQYPKKVCLTTWGDKIEQFALKENEVVTASIELESREYNGRWYTDVKAWRVERDQQPPIVDPPAEPDEAQGFDADDGDPEDLPF